MYHCDSFADCLRLLDGRLNQLSTFIVIIVNVKDFSPMEFNSNKVLNIERNTDYSGSTPVTTIHMTDGEATCCMGWAWTSCIDKRTNRITLKTFIAWYIVATCVDIIITVIFYLILYHWHRIYV
ncbi:unnamed protein product [Rotaria sp. Silwood1]|nr:unnamed protein product [Rotaria sp. Silwood1]CAF4831605.1 unnamed protein product [Rotaria sp. Silwood1]